jgi:hypothetical protein
MDSFHQAALQRRPLHGKKLMSDAGDDAVLHLAALAAI